MNKEEIMKERMKHLSFEIQSYEKTLSNIDRINKTRRIKVNLAKGAKFVQLIVPYAIAVSLTIFVPGALFDLHPFLIDEVKCGLHKKVDLDSFGHNVVSKEYEYNPFAFEKMERLYHYTPFELDGDGIYRRTVTLYDVENISVGDALKCVYNNELDKDIIDIISSQYIEETDSITEEELQKGEFIRAIYSFTEHDDYIIRKEDTRDNIIYTISWLAIVLMLRGIMEFDARTIIGKYDIIAEKLEKNYAEIDSEEMKRKVKRLRDNYEVLTRG